MRLVQNSIPVIASMALVIAWKTLMEASLHFASGTEYSDSLQAQCPDSCTYLDMGSIVHKRGGGGWGGVGFGAR